MRKNFIVSLVGFFLIGFVSVLNAAMFQSVPASKAKLIQEGNNKKSCIVCGMNLVMFYKTNYIATVDGKEKQYCSLHCLVADIEENHVHPQNIQVVDTNSLKFIDAKTAFYVIGSSKKGTMSHISKYAFSSLNAASKFAAKFGGIVSDFNGAVEAAKNDF